MPLPTPQAEESQEDFINRCMGNEDVQKEADGMDERNAICFSQWENKEKAGRTEQAKESPAIEDEKQV